MFDTLDIEGLGISRISQNERPENCKIQPQSKGIQLIKKQSGLISMKYNTMRPREGTVPTRTRITPAGIVTSDKQSTRGAMTIMALEFKGAKCTSGKRLYHRRPKKPFPAAEGMCKRPQHAKLRLFKGGLPRLLTAPILLLLNKPKD